MKKSPDTTSRRSVIQATDSTRSGCTANRSAAAAAPSAMSRVDARGQGPGEEATGHGIEAERGARVEEQAREVIAHGIHAHTR